MQLLAAGALEPGNVFYDVRPLEKFLVFFDRKNVRNRFAVPRDDLGFANGRFHVC